MPLVDSYIGSLDATATAFQPNADHSITSNFSRNPATTISQPKLDANNPDTSGFEFNPQAPNFYPLAAYTASGVTGNLTLSLSQGQATQQRQSISEMALPTAVGGSFQPDSNNSSRREPVIERFLPLPSMEQYIKDNGFHVNKLSGREEEMIRDKVELPLRQLVAASCKVIQQKETGCTCLGLLVTIKFHHEPLSATISFTSTKTSRDDDSQVCASTLFSPDSRGTPRPKGGLSIADHGLLKLVQETAKIGKVKIGTHITGYEVELRKPWVKLDSGKVEVRLKTITLTTSGGFPQESILVGEWMKQATDCSCANPREAKGAPGLSRPDSHNPTSGSRGQ